MGRRKLLVALAGLAVVVAAVAVVASSRPSRITRENFSRITNDMDRAQMLALFGPPADNRSGPTELDFADSVSVCTLYKNADYARSDSSIPTIAEDLEWHEDTSRIYAMFDGQGKLVLASYYPARRQEQGIVENLVWRAQRQWHRCFPE
jgi:hypothetical protein